VAALVVPAAACEDTTVPTTPTPDPPVVVNDTFNGSLNLNGAATFTFAVGGAGDVVATITAVSPDAAISVGLSLGTVNGGACQEVLSNDNAAQGTSILGRVSRNANVCVRVRDIGKLTEPITFTMTVVHP
jgi:hypothetical protein